jgi:hypothetical protein
VHRCCCAAAYHTHKLALLSAITVRSWPRCNHDYPILPSSHPIITHTLRSRQAWQGPNTRRCSASATLSNRGQPHK